MDIREGRLCTMKEKAERVKNPTQEGLAFQLSLVLEPLAMEKALVKCSR